MLGVGLGYAVAVLGAAVAAGVLATWTQDTYRATSTRGAWLRVFGVGAAYCVVIVLIVGLLLFGLSSIAPDQG